MAASFSRTLRSLSNDTGLRSVTVLAVMLSCALVWALWFAFGTVHLRETTTAARLELSGKSHSVQVLIGGRVAKLRMPLGGRVQRGEPLLELDTKNVELELESAQQRRALLERRIPMLRAELGVIDAAVDHATEAGRVAAAQARARMREERARARWAQAEAERLDKLAEAGVTSQVELMRSKAEAESRRASLDVLGLQPVLEGWQRRREQDGFALERGRTVQRLDELDEELASVISDINRLSHQLDLLIVRSPINGEIGAVMPLAEGAVVRDGEQLGSIISEGAPLVVGQLRAATAVGRVRPGQAAHVRFASFPWTEFGGAQGVVSGIAADGVGTNVRVEITLDRESTRVPLRHGLEATAEIEVETVTPAQLIMRAIGRGLSDPASSAEALQGVAHVD